MALLNKLGWAAQGKVDDCLYRLSDYFQQVG